MRVGKGIFVGWYETDPGFQPELDRWHSEEHMPERVALPGFLTGQRYVGISDRGQYCVLYRVDEVRTFVSEPYLNVLNNPTEWTRRMMPGIRNLNRTLCSVVRETGRGFGSVLHTLQFSPAEVSESELVQWLDEQAIPAIAAEPGVVRLTLAIADKGISQNKTNEQALRAQPDAISDWVMLIEAYDQSAIMRLSKDGVLSAQSIEEHGGRRDSVAATFHLSHLVISA